MKCRARCHGPSCEVDVMRLHCLSSPSRSACESCVRSILLTPALSDFDSTANIAWVHKAAGTGATVGRLPLFSLPRLGHLGESLCTSLKLEL